jgi:hypothetical protein
VAFSVFSSGDFGIQDRGKFKINEAKPTIGSPICHIPHLRIVMPNSEFFQLGKQLLHAILVEVVHPDPAIGCHHLQSLRVVLEQPGNKRALPSFEIL